MIVLDTAVLVYAVGDDHRLRAPCRALLQAIGDGRVRGSTTPEVIQEFLHVRARRRPRTDAAALASAYAVALAPLLTVDGDDLERGLDLYARCPALGAFDAVLAAAAQGRGARALVSADRAFATVEGLDVLDPGGEEFLERLEALAGA